ncbi:MAG: 50S ribosomal protein L13 [Candidatus Pacebacteria bacterium CG10_big_fil_rev_8_21_14_0_10_36_11]|nr:50S ribosomal protein L13 [Candidatus Pacearchaeota archaeon]OIP73680.1 MAG: 50S ribosomal protein L13 [Candidatus Pacebacteria bacterium CG2_30_36_39]PIR64738.1 MAG: 50S ribosomal protein L13 [Candidatus Pacebacteria bacterium CG10_big_fil_rev_8_21_14_0_10_36_11]PJC43187.1 MAG: 50S ribosomal protein L13 [Candidatus Pacebacteria bacterium CG_4_9_14_0_2_um_filter_36_8]
MKTQTTFMQRKEDVTREWHLVDVKDKVLGRIATEIAVMLIGKNKPTYTPHTDAGDFVVVINAREVAVTRGKELKKIYYRHTGFPGGLKQRTFEEMIQKNPEEVIRLAVKNMLPKNRLQGERMARLKIYEGAEHKHASQLGGK